MTELEARACRVLRKRACELGLTQVEVARRAHMSPRTVRRVFGGLRCDMPTAHEIARVLRIDLIEALHADKHETGRE